MHLCVAYDVKCEGVKELDGRQLSCLEGGIGGVMRQEQLVREYCDRKNNAT